MKHWQIFLWTSFWGKQIRWDIYKNLIVMKLLNKSIYFSFWLGLDFSERMTYQWSFSSCKYMFDSRSMSNDLELPDSPRAVIRTYSNRKGMDDTSSSTPKRGEQRSNSLRLHAINNNIRKEEKEELEMQMFSAQSSVSIPIPSQVERWHGGERGRGESSGKYCVLWISLF